MGRDEVGGGVGLEPASWVRRWRDESTSFRRGVHESSEHADGIGRGLQECKQEDWGLEGGGNSMGDSGLPIHDED